MKYSSKNIFFEGVKHFNNHSFLKSRSLLKMVVNDPRYGEYARDMLLRMNLREGKLREVREDIESNKYMLSDYLLNHLLAQLENVEYNYSISLKIYEELMKKDNSKYSVEMAKVFMNCGEFDKANEILTSVPKTREFFDHVTFGFICNEIYRGNFDVAFHYFKNINKKNLSREFFNLYYKINAVILYHMGRDPRSFSKNECTDYLVQIMLGNKDILLSHIAKHEYDSKKVNSSFIDNINIEELLGQSLECIKSVNPSFSYISDVYRVILDRPIGVINGKNINGLCVSTITGTDKILSIYPEDFSYEFDKEGLSHDKGLAIKLKR